MTCGFVEKALLLFAIASISAWIMLLIKDYLGKAIKDDWIRFKRMSASRKAIYLVAVSILTHYAATKAIIGKLDSDDDIGIADAIYYSNVDFAPKNIIDELGTTNAVSYVFYITNALYTGSELASKIWYRSDMSQAWTNFSAAPVPMVSSWELNGITTTVWYAFATNAFEHNSFYIGDDLPPVYIEAEGGIALTAFVMNSFYADIEFDVEESTLKGPGYVLVERMWAGGLWQTVLEIDAKPGVTKLEIPGFFVHKRSMWRVRLLVEVQE